jgi:UDP-glucose 4-epimerase
VCARASQPGARVLDLVVSRRVPGWDAVYAKLGWRMAPHIERVYDNARARADLGWQPRHDFATAIARAASTGGDIRSPLACAIGIRGYHAG